MGKTGSKYLHVGIKNATQKVAEGKMGIQNV